MADPRDARISELEARIEFLSERERKRVSSISMLRRTIFNLKNERDAALDALSNAPPRHATRRNATQRNATII